MIFMRTSLGVRRSSQNLRNPSLKVIFVILLQANRLQFNLVDWQLEGQTAVIYGSTEHVEL